MTNHFEQKKAYGDFLTSPSVKNWHFAYSTTCSTQTFVTVCINCTSFSLGDTIRKSWNSTITLEVSFNLLNFGGTFLSAKKYFLEIFILRTLFYAHYHLWLIKKLHSCSIQAVNLVSPVFLPTTTSPSTVLIASSWTFNWSIGMSKSFLSVIHLKIIDVPILSTTN